MTVVWGTESGWEGGGGFGWSPRAGESLRVETPDQRNQSHDCHSRSTPKISAYFPNFWKLNFPALSVFKAEKFECSSDGHNGELDKSYFAPPARAMPPHFSKLKTSPGLFYLVKIFHSYILFEIYFSLFVVCSSLLWFFVLCTNRHDYDSLMTNFIYQEKSLMLFITSNDKRQNSRLPGQLCRRQRSAQPALCLIMNLWNKNFNEDTITM